jgi:hypothetical protein
MFRVAMRLVVSAALVGTVVIGLMTGPAGAMTQAGVASAVANVSPPNVNLVGSGSSVTFDPSSLTVEDTKNGGCTPKHGEWTMTNTTSSKQVIDSDVFPPFSLKPSQEDGFCDGGSPGKIVVKFTLKSSPHAKLKVTTIIP